METTPNATPASETPNGQAPTGETPNTPQPGETPGNGTPTQSPADLQKEIDRLKGSLSRANAEAKENRLAKEELDKLKLAEMSEKERLEKELADLQTKYANETREFQERLTQTEIQRVAMQLGVINPTLAARAIDWAAIEHDEKGAPKNIEKLLKQLVQENPYLVAQGGRTQASPGNGPNPRPTGNTPETTRDKFLQDMRRSGKYGV